MSLADRLLTRVVQSSTFRRGMPAASTKGVPFASDGRSTVSHDMEQLQAWFGELRLRWMLARWHISARRFGLVAFASLASYLALVFIEPTWTLRFSRVLAWPVVALIALFVFRVPLVALFQGQTLKSLSLGPATLELQQGAEDIGATASPTTPELAPDHVIFLLGTLAQIYQVQINFLRHLRQAEDGLTSEAARDWLRNAIAVPDAPIQVIEPLLKWLVDRELTTLRADDRYIVTELGVTFLTGIDGFWYAPKSF